MGSFIGAAAAAWLCLGAAPSPKLLTPAEIVKRLDSSSTRFVIEAPESAGVPVEKYADVFWPRGEGRFVFPVVVEKGGGDRALTEATISEATLRVARAAEPAFQAKDYEAAAALYAQGLEKEPRSFLLLSHLGDCRFKRGQYAEALRLYERAGELIPTDHRLWWYRGQALAHLGRHDEALEAFTEALVRKPADALIVGWLERNAEALGIGVTRQPFAPLVLARREGDAVHVYSDAKGPHWLSYGLCKALWLGEPARRKEALGSADPGFNTFEERECLASLLSTYASLREEGKTAAEPALDRLVRIVEDGTADGFILYELGARIVPWPTLLAGEEAQDQVRRYVRRHVLVRARP